MIVTETIHHGDYRNTRVSHDITSYETFLTWLQQSPYATPAVVATNKYVRKLWTDLRFTGTGSFGWANYSKGTK